MHNDPELLAAYRNGETSAYAVLYERWYGPVQRFLSGGFTFVSRGRTCRFQSRNTALDLEGIAQETFARAFSESTRANYDGERPFRNYLFSIAKNLVLREVQRKEKVWSGEDDDKADMIFGQQASVHQLETLRQDPEDQVSGNQLQELTAGFISGLNEEEKTFFSIRFASGNTQEGTAREMKVTRARVKLLERLLRRRFLAHIRDHGFLVGYTPQPRWTRAASAA